VRVPLGRTARPPGLEVVFVGGGLVGGEDVDVVGVGVGVGVGVEDDVVGVGVGVGVGEEVVGEGGGVAEEAEVVGADVGVAATPISCLVGRGATGLPLR
jgi:hypothetical protein